jgi:hypothetical protein
VVVLEKDQSVQSAAEERIQLRASEKPCTS